MIEIDLEDIMDIDSDFLDEIDTEPFLLTTVQDQLNASASVAGFAYAADSLRREEPVHWTERLSLELDDRTLEAE